jgi:helicase
MKIDDLPIPNELKELLKKYNYNELYPPQEDAIKAGVLENKNIVLASPTASGKTLVAELCILKNVLEKNGKSLYLVPLKALANEKYEEFMKYSKLKKSTGDHIKIAISTGDYDTVDPSLANYDIIVCTNEKADSLLRHKVHWINEVSTIVADEVHLLTEPERGPTLEVVITRLMQINPRAQFLALSATISNAEEIAKWMKAKAITTNWRPVPLKEGVYYKGEIQFKDGSARKIPEIFALPPLDIAIDVVKSNGQALIFAETRKTAVNLGKKAALALKKLKIGLYDKILRKIAKDILEAGEKTALSEVLAEQVIHGAAFHHAGLTSAHRKIVEDAFKKGYIKILSATPTLAAGVNLPARTVIINSYERYEPGYGRYGISVLEYKQLCGRAGRPKYDKWGEAVLIARSSDEQYYLMEEYVLAQPERLWSKLAVEKVLRPHVLATIATRFAVSENGLYDFFGKTFYAFQYGEKEIRPKIGSILKFLLKEDMVRVEKNKLYATEFGKRVSELYIDPVSAVIIRDGLRNKPEKLSEFSLLHLVSSTPDMAPKLYPRRQELEKLEAFAQSHIDELMIDIQSYSSDMISYEEFLAEVKSALVLKEWIDEASEDKILKDYGVEPGDLFRMIETADWLLYATYELAELFKYKNLLNPIENLRIRVQKGVKPELIPLVRLEGIGRIRARSLYNAGFKTIEDLRKASLTELINVPLIGLKLGKKIKEQIGGRIKLEEWKMLKEKTKIDEQKLLTEY